jgi:hypothetical protein
MNNDQEWRQHLFDEIKELRKDVSEIKVEMTTLKIRVAAFSSFVGSIVTYFINKVL